MKPETQSSISQPPAASGSTQSTNKSKLFYVLIALMVLLLAVCGYLGSQYKSTKDRLNSSDKLLAAANAQVAQTGLASEFIAKNNTAELSINLCERQPLGMFDVHINQKYTVFRYLCAYQSNPIRIGAFKKLSDGKYEFTYGSSTTNPNGLPGYIYDTEPGFFGGTYKAIRF